MLDKQPASISLVLDPNVLADLRKAGQLETEDYRVKYCMAVFEVFSELVLRKIEIKSYTDIWPKLSDDARQSVNDAMVRLSAITTAPDNTKAAETLEALGVLQCFIRGDSASGIATLRRAVTLDPTREQAWDMLIGVLAQAHSTDDIVAVCQQRLDAKKSVRNHLIMANIWDLQGRSDEVETHVRAAITLQPDDVLANLAQAALSVRGARNAATLDLASQRITAAAALFTDSTPAAQQAELAVLRCIHAALSGQLDRANDCLDGALRLDPANSSAKDLLEVLKSSRHAAGAQGTTPAAQTEPGQPPVNTTAELRAKAEKGDVQSQVELGEVFFHGVAGLTKDAKEAVKWFQKAAEQNNARAQFNLGCCYDRGQGVAKDEKEAAKWFRKAAEQNFARAQLNLGWCYDWGQGVTKDAKEAVTWYRRAAEQNHAGAQYRLGCCYDWGRGVAKDEKEAVKWYRKAAEQNNAGAQFNLGWCYDTGRGVAKDEKEAVTWYRKAAEQNYADAQHNLGCCYERGRGVTIDEKEAVKWYRKATEQNHASAQYNLGCCYERGRGVASDVKEAVTWYRRAAKQNHANAQYVLGCCYDWGRGVTKDEKEAVTWYRKAAEQNCPDAQYNLGCSYEQGSGVTKDAKEAVTWFRKAAEQNFARAQYNMGCCYERGQGVTKDAKEAVTRFRKAAEQNHAGAQCSLGDNYVNGRGVTKDGAEAVRWYRKAAEQNYALAQYRLGFCYSKGEGTEKDVVEGYRWLLLAARQGYAGAKKAAAELEGTLKAAQIDEGKWRADDWTEHYKFKTH